MPSVHSLDGLMKWIRREEWRDAFADLLDRHLVPACSGADVAVEDLPSLIDEHWLMSLWGCAFEDFLAHELDDGRNVVDDYLKRRGWKESSQTRAYMAALRSSVMSLYEVNGIVVGQSFLARDLVRGGDPVRVSEKSATKSLRQWDRIGTRVLQVGGKTVISGTVLRFDHEASEDLLASLRRTGKGARKKMVKLVRSLDRDIAGVTIEELFGEDMVLGAWSFLFSNIWLSDLLRKTLNPVLPQVTNSVGEALEFVTVRYPLLPIATPKAVRAALATIPALYAESDHFWNWLEKKTPKKSRVSKAPAGHRFVTTMENGAIVLGNIELKDRTLTFSVNSQSRADRGRTLLGSVLTGLVGEPVVECQTLEQMLAFRPKDRPKPSSSLLPEDERVIIHKTLDDRYAGMLDEPVPALGNRTPVKAAKTAKGREKVVAWLKMLENHSAQMPPGDPMADYDFTWLWEKLGVADQRR